jgi:hypothetical protein
MTTGRPEHWRTQANGTLMARAPRSMIRIGVFCLVGVELRGLEPLTPCLQNAPGLSETFVHLGRTRTRLRSDRLVSDLVVVSLGCQRWRRLDRDFLLDQLVPVCTRARQPAFRAGHLQPRESRPKTEGIRACSASRRILRSLSPSGREPAMDGHAGKPALRSSTLISHGRPDSYGMVCPLRRKVADHQIRRSVQCVPVSGLTSVSADQLPSLVPAIQADPVPDHQSVRNV